MTDETALVTGCSSGIGRATALAFLDEEWTVYATARSEADVEELTEAGANFLELDVRDPERCAEVVDRVFEEQGRIDCLVNNAGYAQPGAVEDVPTRRLHRQFDVNVYGPHRLVRAALPHMRRADEGVVVNVSSAVTRFSVPGYGAYSASKHALEALGDALRVEVADAGVDVVTVEPGPIRTNFEERAGEELDDLDPSGAYDWLYDLLEDRRALGDVGAVSPEEVAAVVVDAATCAHPAPRYPVGQVAKLAGLAAYLPDRFKDRAVGVVRRLVA